MSGAGIVETKDQQEAVSIIREKPAIATAVLPLLHELNSNPQALSRFSLPARTLGRNKRTEDPKQLVDGMQMCGIGEQQGFATLIRIGDKTVEAVISEGAFGKSRREVKSCAQSLGLQIATQGINECLAGSLIAKEGDGSIGVAEAMVLKMYRANVIMDADGCVCIDGSRIRTFSRYNTHDPEGGGVIFMREV
jgi:hypothetical protein